MKKKFRIKRDDIDGYLFILVALVIFSVFTIYPVISAVITSFQNYKPFGSEWVQFDNYKTALSNSLFYKSIKNTAVYTLLTVPFSLVIAFVVALLIMPFKKKTQSLFKALYYIPAVASGVATSVVWLWIYDSSPSGLFNQLMKFLHLPMQNWLASSKTAMLSLIIMSLLNGQGSSIIIYIAALLGIDTSYFEAADIDGATRLQKIWYVTMPALANTIITVLILNLAKVMNMFESVFLSASRRRCSCSSPASSIRSRCSRTRT